MRVIITGGHHISALIVAQELKKRGFEVFWLGQKTALEGDQVESREYRDVLAAGIPFFDLKAGKIQPGFNFLFWLKFLLGFFQAFYLLLKIQPKLIVSWGGYLAAPVVLAGWLLRIPALTHEQSSTAGRANLFIARFAKKILLTWDQSLKYFPLEKSMVIGLPLRKEVAGSSGKIENLGFNNRLPVVYITGGKRGSHVINEAVFEVLEELLELANVVHQTGETSIHSDLGAAKTKAQLLKKKELAKRYLVQGYFESEEAGAILKAADLVVGRAGAHTVYELAVLGKPALLIPIPWLYNNEQMENAKMLQRTGLADILEQKVLKGEVLLAKVKAMLLDLTKYKKGARAAKELTRKKALKAILKEIESV